MNRIVLAALSVLLTGQPAAAETAEALVQRIDSLYHASPFWRVAFEQTVRYPVFNETETESGTLEVGPDGRFRLFGDRHIVVSDGDTLWTHNQRANQLIIDRVDNAGEAVRPADFLLQFEEDYETTICEHDGPGQCLYLKSNDETAFIREMWLWADPQTAHVKRAVYKDVNLNETTFLFKSIDFEFAPDSGAFRYVAPPGVEVVRMP
jgi:outer membrane lipoprotein-sorting protein